MQLAFAHSRKAGDERPWQSLAAHLRQVSQRAAEFVPDGWRALAATSGLWHDIGKYQPDFQRYIRDDPELSNEGRRVPHSIVGAALALRELGESEAGIVLAMVIAAHHGALKSPSETLNDCTLRGEARLRDSERGGLPAELLGQRPDIPPRLSALGVRMLFSALVDADLLDTEAWDLGEERDRAGETLEVLQDRLDLACQGKIRSALQHASSHSEEELAAMRAEVYRNCLMAAPQPRQQFTLTVPTGGGKTLSGMAFALRHAIHHGLQRVIVAAPFTSILEQTADVYRQVLGADNVIEHHSNISPAVDTDRNRQACENWDAPIIVTTSVQLLESLHAAHKRSCRKLHRIAGSVILLDEVQALPDHLLQPIHAVLQLLVDDFGCTIVHCTATQPLLATYRPAVPGAVLTASSTAFAEIIADPPALFEVVRHRYGLEVLGTLDTPLDPAVLAEHVRAQWSALVITHRRDDARQLAEMLGDDCLHLSAAMCAEHRTEVLKEAKRRLQQGLSCRLVATQLVEAGVDIDFPVVYRAMAGLETLAQAAGRCNRSMSLPQPGRFVVYRAGQPGLDDEPVRESKAPPGTPRIAMQMALKYFKADIPDLNDPSLFPEYMAAVLPLRDTDRPGILGMEAALHFPEVEAAFRMIDERKYSVIAPYGEGPALVAMLQRQGPTRDVYRRLQRYTVGVSGRVFEALYRSGWLEPVGQAAGEAIDTLWTVRSGEGSPYHPRFGFSSTEQQVGLSPLMV